MALSAPLILRCVQLLLLIICVALIGNVIASNVDGHMTTVNYALFALVVCWIASLWGLASNFISMLSEGILGYALLAVDILSTFFILVAAIAIPAKLRAIDCGGDLSVDKRGKNWIAFGSNDTVKRCRELQASSVFLWFLLVPLCGILFMAFANFRRGGGARGSGGSSAPHMSQVRV